MGDASPSPAAEPPAEDLPDDYLPLTPELVEEDAQRNDFVLRVAVVLLAFLLGCTEIGETETLVHVRSGEYLAAHGVLPPRTDVFSYTAADRPWVNLSWLFDLGAAGVYGLAGAVGLTLVKALLAAVAFFFVVHTGRAGVSTWWAAILAALAVVVCSQQFTAMPEIITLVGVAAGMWLLNRWEHDGRPRHLWVMAGLLVVWANLDPRAFIGALLIVLYAIGTAVGRLLGREAAQDGRRVQTLGIAGGASVVALLIHPFLWNSLLAPLRLYGVEYPAWQMYRGRALAAVKEVDVFPLAGTAYWQVFQTSSILRVLTIAALALAASALITMVLNRQRLRGGHVALFAGVTGLALAGSHELAAASIVWAVLANLNAQEWYQHTFRQTYSIDFSERLFSTGGRFVTVLGLVVLALFAIAGHLAGSEGNRIGFGFRQPLAAAMQGLAEDLEDLPDDHRVFNLIPRQGDIMIWAGRPPFIDSRITVFAGRGENDLPGLHLRTRDALRRRTEDLPHSGDRKLWRDVFTEHDVACVLVHLAGRVTRYEYYLDLLGTGDFRLTRLGSVSAVLHWANSPREDVRQYAADEQFDLVASAFRPENSPEVPLRFDTAQPPSWYESMLNLPKVRRPTTVLRARHYDLHTRLGATGAMPFSPEEALAATQLAIHHAHRALAEDPSLAEAYRILGRSYAYLEFLEGRITTSGGGANWSDRRYLQAVNAYRQALTVEPNDLESWERLAELFVTRSQPDLALEAVQQMQRLLPDGRRLEPAMQRQLNEQWRVYRQAIEQLQDTVGQVNAQIEQHLGQQGDTRQAIEFARRSGCVLRALELMASLDEMERMRDPLLRLAEGQLLLEAGRTQRASQVLFEVEPALEGVSGLSWRHWVAMGALVRGEFDHATALWAEDERDFRERQFEAVFSTLPLSAPMPEFFHEPGMPGWPLTQLGAFGIALDRLPAERVQALFNVALTHLETGQIEKANEAFTRLLEADPNTALRPLVATYYSQTSGSDEPIEPHFPFDLIPITPDLFAPEPETEPQPDAPGEAAEAPTAN